MTDCDTITLLLANNTTVRIRFEGIGCPEAKQYLGQKAKQSASELCYGKVVTVVKTGKIGMDALGYVDGVCVNDEQLKKGMAWHYKKYNKDEK